MERLLVEADTRAAVSKTNGLQYIKHLSGPSFELVTKIQTTQDIAHLARCTWSARPGLALLPGQVQVRE